MFRVIAGAVFILSGLSGGMLSGMTNVIAGDSHIVADSTAPGNQRPEVIPTANGLPQVNINTPNGNGLSYNRYRQFDVGQRGAILNNSTVNTQTQLGGWIERNPNLANGSASLIVNEVNSSKPSHLGGFVEVAGQRADVVIANPSGISVSGGGFINANRATLTTGIPIIENGSLSGFDVRGGHIDISGDGLNNKQSDFTDIIARSVSVNAKIHADKELNVVAGGNFVTPDGTGVTRTDLDAETGVSIDVKSLGGMYAGQIRLIGTGRGVGVNSIQNAGEIAAGAGEVYITADGRLMNINSISGRDGIRIDVGDDIVNRGTILSGGDMAVDVGRNFSNDNSVTATGTLTADVGNIVRNKGGIVADGIVLAASSLQNTGSIDATDMLIKSGEVINVDSGAIFGDRVAIEAGTIVNGASAYTGHRPITHTRYNSKTNTYSYRDDEMADYGDGSDGFDRENAIADSEEEFELGAPSVEEGAERPESAYDPGDDEYQEAEVGAGESEKREYTPEAGRKTTTGNAGMISARDSLDIGFSDLLFNRDDGLILSGGDMRIGGALDENRHAVGTGGILDNHSATIDAGGDLYMDVAELENLNAHYRTEERLVFSGSYTGYRFGGDPKVYLAGIDRIVKGKTKRGAWKISYPWDAEDFFQYSINRKIYDQFIVESRPAYITSGGDIRIAGSVTNNRSKMIAGKNVAVDGNLTNIRSEEARVTRDSGSAQWTWVTWANKLKTKHKRKYSYAGPYNPAPVFEWSERDVTLFGNPDITQPGANPMAGVLNALANSNIASTGALNGGLWGLNASPDAMHIVESDPRFANYRNWLSSDYMVKRLSADPQVVLKRLGDGYYEQRLVRDQIVNKTGLRYLKGYDSDEEQYAALMTAGVEFAEDFELELGVTLSAELMARLTSDIVWLEWVTVETPDGPVRALAPVVYLAPGREILLAENGGMVSGREVEIKGELRNAGNILGDSVALSGNDLNNSGAIAGGLVSMAAVRDIVNNGGVIIGEKSVELQAGRDIAIASNTYTTSTANGSRTEIGSVGGVYVTDEEGHLSAQAGRDVNLKAADVNSAGTLELAAGNDLNIGGVTVEYEHKTGANGNYLHDKTSEDIGSTVSASGDMTLSAGRDANITGSYVLGDGEIHVEAGRDVAITEGRSESYHETKSHEESSGFFSSKTKDTHYKDYANNTIDSELSGNTVVIESGNDFTLRGSTVAASNGVSVEAEGDIKIETAENASDSYAWKETKRSGFGASFGGGRVGVSYGTTKKGNESETAETWNSGSMLGSENGDVSLHADKDVAVTGSQVIAGTGDVAISGENVVIDNAYDTTDSKSREWHEQKSIGISVGLGGAVGNAINSGMSALNNAERSQNAMTDRAGALYGIAGARDAYETGKAVVDMATSPGGVMNGGNLGLSVELGFSSSKSESRQESHDTSVVGSYIQSGGDTAITARDDLAVIGSEIHAGGEVTLDAANDLALLSTEETTDFSSSNKSSSFGVGASIGVGAGINVGLNGNMSQSKGSGQGSGDTHVETIIQGDAGVDFTSGDDTTLKGAQIIGDQVTGAVGGDLAIISEQDTYNESRKQSSSGGGISIGTGLGGGLANVGGNYSSQNQKGKSDYASVDEQSGIYAGEGGFDITVGGNTHLEGAVIASEADPENNTLTTGSITTRDIENSMSYDSTTKGFGGEFTYARNPGNGDKNANTGSISPSLPMKENGDDHSTTKSAIADGSIVITNEESQLAKTGQTAEEAIADLNRDTDNAHSGALERPASLEELFAKQAELTEAAGLAGKAVAQTVGDISQSMYEQNPKDKRWAEGGIYRAMLHAAGAALVAELGNGEGLNAALGAMASQLAAKNIGEFTQELASHFSGDPAMQKLVANVLSNVFSDVVGFAAGGESGGNLASLMNRYNMQLHPEKIDWIEKNSFALLKKLEEMYPDMQWTDESVRSLMTMIALGYIDAGWAGQFGLPTTWGTLGSDSFYSDPAYTDWFKTAVRWVTTAQDSSGGLVFYAPPQMYYDSSFGVENLTYNLKMENLGIEGRMAFGEFVDFYLKYAAVNIVKKDPGLSTISVPRNSDGTKYLPNWYDYVDGVLYPDDRLVWSSDNLAYRRIYDRFGNLKGGEDTGIAPSDPISDLIIALAGDRGVRYLGKGFVSLGGRMLNSSRVGFVGISKAATNAAHSSINYARYKSNLTVLETAGDVIASLKNTGKLPSNYVTKAQAIAKGWSGGKAVNNYVPGGQIGGDIYNNTNALVPSSAGRLWYEADVGLVNTASRAKQVGTRLLYSNDGLMYITTNHYKTASFIGRWK